MALKWLSLPYCIARQGTARAARTTDDSADPATPSSTLIESLATAAESEASAYLAVRYPDQVAAGTASDLVKSLCYELYVDKAQQRRLISGADTAQETRELLEKISRGFAVIPEWEVAAAAGTNHGFARARHEFTESDHMFDSAFDQQDPDAWEDRVESGE